MTDLALPMIAGVKLPDREELRKLMFNPPVMITAIICGTLLALASIGAVVYLAVTGNDTTVVGVLITGTLAAVGVLLSSRMRRMEGTMSQQKTQE